MLARQLFFFAPAAVMSAWATVMLHTYAAGHLNRLLNPMFRGYVLAAAAVLVVLSVLHLLLYQAGTETVARGRIRQLGRWLVLLIPVVAAAVLSPSAFSSTTLANRSSTAGAAPMPTWDKASQDKAKEALDADPNQPVPVEVTDLITLSRSPDQYQAFENRKVRTVGLLYAPPGSAPKLIRMIMWCCAADAQPAAVELAGTITDTWKDSQWLEVVGTAHFTSNLGKVVPSIKVESITPTQEPDEPYLSP